MIIEFISNNWPIITTGGTAIIYLYTQVMAMRKGIKALLRADLIRMYNKYYEGLGYCPIYVQQALTEEYKQYHALKGNGVGTKLYNAIMSLPTEPPKKKEETENE